MQKTPSPQAMAHRLVSSQMETSTSLYIICNTHKRRKLSFLVDCKIYAIYTALNAV